MEIKRIEGFEDYGITRNGLVISYKNKIPKILKGFINKGGYKYVDLCKNNQIIRFGVHQLVAQAYVNGWFEGAVVNHKDGNNSNNNWDNLEWTTQKDNIHKSYKTSGIGPMRNYLWHILEYPNGIRTDPFPGQQPLKDYILQQKLDLSISSLFRHGHSRGYKLITLH